jgi:hypothetical protein
VRVRAGCVTDGGAYVHGCACHLHSRRCARAYRPIVGAESVVLMRPYRHIVPTPGDEVCLGYDRQVDVWDVGDLIASLDTSDHAAAEFFRADTLSMTIEF